MSAISIAQLAGVNLGTGKSSLECWKCLQSAPIRSAEKVLLIVALTAIDAPLEDVTLLCGIDWFVYVSTAGYWRLFNAQAFAFFEATGCERQITTKAIAVLAFPTGKYSLARDAMNLCQDVSSGTFRSSRFNCGKCELKFLWNELANS